MLTKASGFQSPSARTQAPADATRRQLRRDGRRAAGEQDRAQGECVAIPGRGGIVLTTSCPQRLVKVRSLYGHEDLETAYISPKSRHPSIIRLVQGKHQLVLGDFDEIILLENIISPLTDVARVRLDGINLPVLTVNARWMCEDMTVARGQKIKSCVLFSVENVSGSLFSCVTNRPD